MEKKAVVLFYTSISLRFALQLIALRVEKDACRYNQKPHVKTFWRSLSKLAAAITEVLFTFLPVVPFPGEPKSSLLKP
jgi:hypothetical protein